MLPTPATSSSRSNREKRWTQSPSSWRLSAQPSNAYPDNLAPRFNSQFLRSRARTTNLAVLLLLGFGLLSLLINIRLYFGDRVFRPHKSSAGPYSSLQREIPSYASSLKNLIMVPGHSIWIGNKDSVSEAQADSEWILQELQKGGTVKTLIKHIVKGVELVAQDPTALLIFSGGQTRPQVQASEGQSYLRYAEAAQLFNQYIPSESPSEYPFPRATSEDFALDSYENLLFSIARFREITGHYPKEITVIGFGMKRKRFEQVHRAAIRWPMDHFHYIGIDNENESGQSYSGELQYGLQPFLADTYGCHSSLLNKKRGRNNFNRYHPYFTSAPELAGLLDYCPTQLTKTYDGRLPWS